MQINIEAFKEFTNKDEATQWGKEHYSNWMQQLQDQNYKPVTPAEQFFRYYTQGIHYLYNRILRTSSIEKYDFEDSIVTKEMFIDGINEIKKQRLSEDILVYRYVDTDILKDMKKWSGINLIKQNSILTDRGFFSTTLSLDAVSKRDYATFKHHSLLYIYVPKGTPCTYVDLISDMNENELLFAPNIKLKVLSSHRFGKCIMCVVINE